MVLVYEVFDDVEVLCFEGCVKWYDLVCGYGFIDVVDGQGDIFFYVSCF